MPKVRLTEDEIIRRSRWAIVAKYMTENGLKKPSLAKRWGVSTQCIYNYEQHPERIPLDIVKDMNLNDADLRQLVCGK